MKFGGFTFVLHSHLPYCRQAGRWPHGEEWIHEAAAETYLPLLNALYDLRQDRVAYKLTIGITPILTEQLADSLIQHNFVEYLDERITAASTDIERFSSEGMTRARDDARRAAKKATAEAEERARAEAQAKAPPTDSGGEANPAASAKKPITTILTGKEALEAAAAIKEQAALGLTARQTGKPQEVDLAHLTVQAKEVDLPKANQALDQALNEPEDDQTPVPAEQRYYLAQYYRDWYTNIKTSFLERYNSDIIRAFRTLQDEGLIEIITCAATHGYLPLVERDSTIYAQIATGIQSYVKHFGRKPRAIWLPECAYRPAYYATDEQGHQYLKPGIEDFLAEQGISLFFTETHTIEGGVPVGKAAGENIIGPYSYITRRYVIPAAEELPRTNNTTFQPYWVVRPDVAVIGRNNRTGMQVWSSENGYPGDKDYREFHSKDSGSGLQYWRITGPKVDLGQKDFYHPEWIPYRTKEHAAHFIGLVEQQLKEYYEANQKPGLISCNYDTELFGHWWFEGVDWLKEVLRGLSSSETVEITTASGWLEKHPPEVVMAIPESSWGQQGTHFVWMNDENAWIWQPIHAAERRMEKLAAQFGSDPDPDKQFVLQQAAREVLLLESSDWPFLITTGQAKDYAVLRFEQHTERFNSLADGLESSDGHGLAPEVLEAARKFNDLDNPFPEIDPQFFREREKVAES
jgi:1,4-alpha-glucan branching enzyme